MKTIFIGLSKTWQISFPYRRYYIEYDLTFLHNSVSSLQVPWCPECSLMCKSILPLIDRLTHLEFYTFLSTHHYLTIAITGLILKACPPYSCSWPVHVKAAFPKMSLQEGIPWWKKFSTCQSPGLFITGLVRAFTVLTCTVNV